MDPFLCLAGRQNEEMLGRQFLAPSKILHDHLFGWQKQQICIFVTGAWCVTGAHSFYRTTQSCVAGSAMDSSSIRRIL